MKFSGSEKSDMSNNGHTRLGVQSKLIIEALSTVSGG